MTYYACIAIGHSDFLPNRVEYIAATSKRELSQIVNQACREWDSEEREDNPGTKIYRYKFRVPSNPSINNYSQRLRIGGASDWVLDVIGMTECEYERGTA